MSAFFSTAWQNIVQTTGYLFAYSYVLVLAPAAHLALLALGPERRGWLAGRRGPLAALILGLTEPLSRSSMDRSIRRLNSPESGVVYLGVSHTLTAYSWILLGPLLGKDFLLSHVVGVTLFVSIAAVLSRWSGISIETSGPDKPIHRRSLGKEQAGAVLRFAFFGVLGLGLGGLVAAWGFSRWSWAPAELGAGGLSTQFTNGALGLVLALLGVAPVANLFVGTYLWKTGLAQAGMVAFLCASTAAPTRWRLYSRTYGRRRAARLVCVLLTASLVAGLVTAWIFGALDLSIHYKLIPQQLWDNF